MTKKSLKTKADQLFREIVRKDKICEWCGHPGIKSDFECAHIFSRRYLSTRWDLLNALCLCHACHRRAHSQPVEFTEFVKEYLGPIPYQELREKAKIMLGSSRIGRLKEVIEDLKFRKKAIDNQSLL